VRPPPTAEQNAAAPCWRRTWCTRAQHCCEDEAHQQASNLNLMFSQYGRRNEASHGLTVQRFAHHQIARLTSPELAARPRPLAADSKKTRMRRLSIVLRTVVLGDLIVSLITAPSGVLMHQRLLSGRLFGDLPGRPRTRAAT
jgi:hypothetical protein